MNIRQFLMGSLAFAAIGGASTVGLYYQSLTMERKERKRKADKYYLDELHHWFYKHKESGDDKHFMRVLDAEDKMRQDGYSNAEIGILEVEGRNAARKNFEYIEELRKNAERSEAFIEGLNKLSKKLGLDEDEDSTDTKGQFEVVDLRDHQ